MTFTGIPPVDEERDLDQETAQSNSGRRQEFYDSFASPFQDKGLFSSAEGMGIMSLGVLLPGVLLGAAAVACCDRITMMILKHPLETLIELALAVMVPVANYVVWKSLSRDDRRFAKRRGIMNGIAIGTSSIIAAIGWAAVILHYPAIDESSGNPHPGAFTSIALIATLAAAASVYLANSLRVSRELHSSQLRTVAYSVLGVIFAALLFVGSEARSVCIRVAEYMSTSESAAERKNGLDFLRQINPERDLMMECADVRTAGIPGLFIRIEPTTQRQLYFSVTGKPFRDDKSSNFSSMPDEYLQKHVVGAPVTGLSLIRSAMTGVVNPTTLSATVNWTFVFKNRTYQKQEARAEIGLPEGAVISQMTVWPGGEPTNARFNASGMAASTVQSPVEAGHDAPAIVTDLGRGRTLLHCYPVPAQGEMKVRVAVVVPLKLHTLTEASVSLPRFIDNNFAIATDNSMSIRSPEKLTMNLKGIRSSVSATGEKVLSGVIKEEDLSGSGLSIRVARSATIGPNVIKDPFVHADSYIIQTIKKVEAPAPSHLVLVVDGSQSVKDHLKEIKSAIAKLPASITKSVIIASDQNGAAPEVLPFTEGMKQLDKVALTGGQDNLQSVVKAAELAGEAKGGTVLWIHGPQPSFNEEIYIMAPYIATPKFYELALDNGVMDAHEFFKNHREIGPFSAIARSATAGDDLERFIAKWQPGGTDFAVDYTAVDKAETSKTASAAQANEIACLAANQKVEEMLHKGKVAFAAVVACSHNIVTPVSLASVLPHQIRTNQPISTARNADVTTEGQFASQPATINTTSNELASSTVPGSYSQSKYDSFSQYSPTLQGATNGTIGPQGADATYITGINTAGTVRVNNMANLEAMLNIMANGLEILGILFGGALAAKAIFALAQGSPKDRDGLSHPARLAYGLVCIVGGLAAPGVINWFVASARDANLFS
ncbi:MAG: hypothetical protein C0469_11090 [Cyanobacteria bacterium DS2.3.42]|nr:hypothetical protein [Cyanobacteria bacterium DS2.3.42]